MTSMHPHENTLWPVPDGTPAHVAKAVNDRGTYNGAVRSALWDIIADKQLEAALDMSPEMLADTYDLLPRDGWALHNAMRERSDHRKPPAREYKLSSDEAGMVFGLLTDYCENLQQYIRDAVADGNYEGAADRAEVLRTTLALAARMDVATHKKIDSQK